MTSVFPTLILALACSLTSAYAQDNAGVIGAGGDFAYQTGVKGALTNRKLADQLYTNALTTENQAWSTFPPNIRMLAKSVSMGKDAHKANAQATEFSRASLHALSSGKQSGNFDAARFNMIEESQLKNWASVENPLAIQAKQRFGRYEKYGISLGSDRATLKTPVGDLNLSGDLSSGALAGIASALGYNPEDVKAGLQDGIDERNRLVAEVTAAAEAEIAKNQALAATADATAGAEGPERETASASEGTANSNAGANDDQSGSASSTAGGANDGAPGMNPQVAGGPNTEADDAAIRQRALDANLEELRQKMAANAGFIDPIGNPGQNIFTMVRDRYQNVRAKGRLLEDLPH